MRLTIDCGWDGLRRRAQGCAAGLLFALPAGALAATQPGDAQPTTVVSSPAVVPSRPVLPWINEVVKMNAAAIPPDVIKNYVANTTSRSMLTADDIIYLRNNGVASDIITAMIAHGAAPAPLMASAPAPVAPQYYPPQQYQPPAAYADQTPPPDYYDYGQPYPYAYSYSYSYPAYYPYYPAYWYPYTTFVVGGGRNHAFFRGDRNDRFGRSSFGNAGGRNSGGVWTPAPGGHLSGGGLGGHLNAGGVGGHLSGSPGNLSGGGHAGRR